MVQFNLRANTGLPVRTVCDFSRFLSRAEAPQIVQVLVAIIWGVGGVALLYVGAKWLVLKLPKAWLKRLQPFVFVGPAVAIMGWFLAIPVIRSLFVMLLGHNGWDWITISLHLPTPACWKLFATIFFGYSLVQLLVSD